MDFKKFYDNFHKGAKIQNKLITDNSFTYSKILTAIKSSIPKGKSIKILDFGCGVGSIALYLANKGHKVVGLDISPKAIKIANKSAQVNSLNKSAKFYVHNGSNSINCNETFDLIILSEVLEHIKNDRDILISLKKLLTKNGHFFITVPSSNAPLYKLGLTKKFDNRVGHLRRYNKTSLTSLMKTSGLKIIHINKVEGFIRNSLFILKPLGFLIRFIKGPLVKVVTTIDDLTIDIFGESDLFILASKK